MNKTRALPLAASLIAGALVAARFLLSPSSTATPALKPLAEAAPAEQSVQANRPPVPQVSPPDLSALVGRLGAGMMPPTPEQIAEDGRMEREQVADGLRSLRSPEPDERAGGAQQLAAYPTKEAEQALAEALAGDRSAPVRAAAAQALTAVKTPSPHSIGVLLKALRDRDREVRAVALATLEAYLNGLDPDATAYRRVYQGLVALAKSGRLDRDTRANVRELLADFPR